MRAKQAHRLPQIMAVLLIAITCVGLIRIYALGGKALNTMTISERKKLSRSVDLENPDYRNNDVVDPYAVYGTISTTDGVALFGPTVSQTELSPAYASLIGLVGDENNVATRYVANNYLDVLLPVIDYSPMTGIPRNVAPELVLTLTDAVQQPMYDFLNERDVQGCVFAYDYEDGDIVCMVSTPGAQWGKADAGDGSFINKAFYNTTPGSTMKLITLVLLKEQGYDPEKLYFTCEGSYALQSDHQSVNCTGIHGTINGVTAIGQSCNCWFAQSIELLNQEQVAEDLAEMGWTVNGTGMSSLGAVPRSTSSVKLNGVWDFESVWGLIGQGASLVSPIDMAVLAGEYATGGNAVLPRLLSNEETSAFGFGQEHQELLQQLRQLWVDGFQENYPLEQYDPRITAAKTGTADELGADGSRTQKTLCGYSDATHTAFYLIVENAQNLETTTAEIANYLISLIGED